MAKTSNSRDHKHSVPRCTGMAVAKGGVAHDDIDLREACCCDVSRPVWTTRGSLPVRKGDGPTRARASDKGYPPPFAGYGGGVFDHQGILHRNSCTKSRAMASSLIATLKRRDCPRIDDDMGLESLGDGVSGAGSARTCARPPSGTPSTSPNQLSSLVRSNFWCPGVDWVSDGTAPGT